MSNTGITNPIDRLQLTIGNYLEDKGLECSVMGSIHSIHLQIYAVTKKFYLGVILPELRNLANDCNMYPSGSTFFTGFALVRFYKRTK